MISLFKGCMRAFFSQMYSELFFQACPYACPESKTDISSENSKPIRSGISHGILYIIESFIVLSKTVKASVWGPLVQEGVVIYAVLS